jgi:hypothetical protein
MIKSEEEANVMYAEVWKMEKLEGAKLVFVGE